nr:ribonuclease H-like domain-containing protein [Tanacetum cinerariifolium]
ENQTNSNAGFQDTAKAGEEGTQTYVLFHVFSDGSTNPKNNKDAHTAENKDKGKSPVVTITGFKDLNEEFVECFNNNSNEVNAAGSSVSAARLNFRNSTNDFSAAGLLNAAMPNLEDLSYNADDVEILQFKMQKVWILVNLPYGKREIGTKLVYRNKKGERGTVIRNKSRLVAQGHTQEEGIDYEEVFAPVAR